MTNISTKNYMKATQALNFFAQKKEGRINKMKAIKLIYFADKLHLRKYGRPIIGDSYVAMKHGPVASTVKRIAEYDLSDHQALSYAKKYIKPVGEAKLHIESLSNVDMTLFSETDVECLELAYEAFKDQDQYELRDLTHTYPEWKKFEFDLSHGKRVIPMDYDDFFEIAKKDDVLFMEKKPELTLSKEIFQEYQNSSNFFSS